MGSLTVIPRFFPLQLGFGAKIFNKVEYWRADTLLCCEFLFETSCVVLRGVSKMPAVEKTSLKYTKVIPDAFPPTKGSPKAAGYDLKSAEDVTVCARGKALVDTGLKIELPKGCYGRIAPRSGLAVKNFIDVGGNKPYCI